MKNEEKILIPKHILTDLITELRVIDVALYRFSQGATTESSVAPHDVNKSFAALFAEKRMGQRISSVRVTLVDYLTNGEKFNESDLDEIDNNCASKLLEDFNIKY